MYNPGLSAANLRKLHATLRTHHSIRVQVDVLDLDGDTLYALDKRVNDGQVDIDATAEPTRTATVSFIDPDNDIRLNLNRMLRIWYGVLVPDVGWVDVPIITGPVTKLDWSDSLATATVVGKESFHLSPAFRPFTLKKRTKKTDAIRTLLRRGGENRFDIPNLKPRMPNALSVSADDVRWAKAQKLADSLNRQLFYNGRGQAVLRRLPGNPVFTFNDGNGPVLTAPQTSITRDRVRNAVRIKGGFPKAVEKAAEDADKKLKESERVRYSVTAPHSHPLSPWGLGYNDEPLYLPESIDNDQIRSKAEARALANRRLDDGLRAESTVTFDSLVIPHLEENDLIRVTTAAVTEICRARQFSIPLSHAGVMPVGYRKLVSRPTRRNAK